MTRTVANQMVETLAAAGVEHIYGIVGDSLNGFTDALRRRGGVELSADGDSLTGSHDRSARGRKFLMDIYQ
jgi:hypothetical protein